MFPIYDPDTNLVYLCGKVRKNSLMSNSEHFCSSIFNLHGDLISDQIMPNANKCIPQGDSVIRYFEITPEPPFVHYINTFQVFIND